MANADLFLENVLDLIREGLGVEDIAIELKVDADKVRAAVETLRKEGSFEFWKKRNPPSREK